MSAQNYHAGLHQSSTQRPPKRPNTEHAQEPPKRALIGGQTTPSSSGGGQTPNGTNYELEVKQQLSNYQKLFDQATYPFIRDVSTYEKLNKIGQGTFGEVFKARCKNTGRMVALKKILMENEKEGFPITALREVKMLEQLKHPNITDLIEVCSAKSTGTTGSKDRATFYLVMALCAHDLAGLLSNPKIRMSLVHIKTMMKHLMSGLNKLHRSKILHRDMKAANVLISKDGILKLADFGLARPFVQRENGAGPRPLYTNRVVTLWYRPPELLLGDRQYGTKIDVWGAGCIMAEMWTRQPIMQGDTEQKQLQLISGLCGSINKDVWPNCVNMPLWSAMSSEPNSALPQGKYRILPNKMKNLMKFDAPDSKTDPFGKNVKQHDSATDDDALHLLEILLAIDPDKRPTSDEAEDDIWFFKDPVPMANVQDLMDTIPVRKFEAKWLKKREK
ncbi:putative cyclin-dependent kinase 9 [Caenorhabditis elegans]|uniref:Isoform a of Probable cyclin-dependent kinase 9 n=1 Tax=Caenorhabditis elegans TaxID=6239 RepID=Q9TVL3-2|nr:putative cyclin-dependent kinase 9 [Caenorhabditis elegans]CAB07237.2 Probable cyclin-dependent kinase 9 [Caenorhabditis elegans]|eukprot:NP_492907.2 Probable cyclin-dependent kinase 9 [Caenorhabditis elegans]